MKAIGVWIAKGGTGKSTTAGNLANELRKRGRVLIVDCDNQANISSWLLPDQFKYELADVLKGQPLADAIWHIRDNLDIVPTFAIGGSLKNWAETVLPSKPFAFAALRDAIEAQGYDYAIYDMSPGASMLERFIIASLDEVLPVVRPEYFSADGLEIFAATLDQINADMRAKAKAPRLVINGLNLSIALHAQYHAEMIRGSFQAHTIPQTSKTIEAQAAHVFLVEHDKRNRAIDAYAALAEAIA